MNNFANSIPLDAAYIMQAFENAGYQIRIVGGFVRDTVLGKQAKDCDMATNALPDQIIQVGQALSNVSVIPTGLAHGTLTFHYRGENYEITTLRVDVATDGRHADVEFVSDFKLDSQRRDFTYNSMSIDLRGQLYDYFGGYRDLMDGRTRFVGDANQRVTEDYLRILRALRFELRYGAIDDEGREAMARHASGLKQVSGERKWSELKQILTTRESVTIGNLGRFDHRKVYGALKFMNDTNIIAFDMDERLQDTFNLTVNPITRFMRAVGFRNADYFNELFHWSSEEYNLAKSFALFNKFQFNEEAYKMMVAGLAKVNGGLPITKDTAIEIAAYSDDATMHSNLQQFYVPEFPVNGDMLMANGVKPGKQMGDMLLGMRLRWFKSNFTLNDKELLEEV